MRYLKIFIFFEHSLYCVMIVRDTDRMLNREIDRLVDR